MIKQDIQERLTENHLRFADLVSSLNDREFLFTRGDKWTAGQQLDHIYRSVSALNKGLALPKFVIRLYVGKANRPSKDYAGLVAKYQWRLKEGGKAMGRFIPAPVASADKIKLKEKLVSAVGKLCSKINRYSEQQLDDYILPHPLLGKVTVREMLYFTIYHVEHHQKITLSNLGR